MGWKIFGIIVLFLVLLLSLKATFTVEYAGEVRLTLRVLFLRLRLFPKKEKKRPQSMSRRRAERLKASLEKKQEKKRAKKQKKKAAKAAAKAEKKQSGKKSKKSPQEIFDIITTACNLVKQVVGKFFGHLRIDLARIRICVGMGDAASTALVYGAVSQAINVFFPLIEDIKTVSLPKGRDIAVTADFTSDETEIDIKISFSLRVWHLFHIAIAALIELIKHVFRSQKRKDAEAQHKASK